MQNILIESVTTAKREKSMSKELLPSTDVLMPLSFELLSEDQYSNIINQIAELKAMFRQNAIASVQNSPEDFLNLTRAAAYTGFSKSFLYKITASNEATFYKPNGKTIFFKRIDLDNFLSRRKILSNYEISQEAEQTLLGHRVKPLGRK